MHLSVIVQQGQHRRPPSAPALPVAKFIFVRKSTKNPPISTASCPFFPQQTLPASLQHAASAIAPRCITHRTALHRPPHRTAPNAAPLPAVCLTPPSTPFHHPAALSPAPLRTCPMVFPENSKPALPHFPSRTQYIYNVPDTKLHIFEKKKVTTLCQYAKSPYLCNRKTETRAAKRGRTLQEAHWTLSSAGSERLPYKQRVGGSNPSASTGNTMEWLLSSTE